MGGHYYQHSLLCSRPSHSYNPSPHRTCPLVLHTGPSRCHIEWNLSRVKTNRELKWQMTQICIPANEITVFAVGSVAESGRLIVIVLNAVRTVDDVVAHHGRVKDSIWHWLNRRSTVAVTLICEEAVEVFLITTLNMENTVETDCTCKMNEHKTQFSVPNSLYAHYCVLNVDTNIQ